jgi:hypothetical protein
MTDFAHAAVPQAGAGARGEHPDSAESRLRAAWRQLEDAPREALADAIFALNHGLDEAMEVIRPAVRRLGLLRPEATMPLTLSTMRMIERGAGLPDSHGFKIINAGAAAGGSMRFVTNPLRLTPTPPLGDGFHPVFGTAGAVLNVPGVAVFALDQGIVSFDLTMPGGAQIYVFDRNRACVENLSRGTVPFIDEPVTEIAGDLAIIGDRFCGSGDADRFLFDHLTRVALFDAFTEASPEVARLLLADPNPDTLEILRQAGLASRVVAAGSKRFSMRAGCLLAATNMLHDLRHPCHDGAGWAIGYLRDRFDAFDETTAPAGRYFITDAAEGEGGLRNVGEVADVAAAHGFQTLALSTLTVGARIDALREASAIVSVNGAGLAATVLAPPGLRVLDILPPAAASPACWRLCHAAGHHYVALAADPAGGGEGFVVDPRRLDRFLRETMRIPASGILHR